MNHPEGSRPEISIACPRCGRRPLAEFGIVESDSGRGFRRVRGPLGIIRLVRHRSCREITYVVLRRPLAVSPFGSAPAASFG